MREAGEQGESRVLEGYALKFGVRSVLLGYMYPFYEILEKGCITDEMLREQRIYFTMFHDRQSILGRWDKGEGTLKLTIDDIGLKVECEMPETEDGDKALELVRRGDLSEMSFAYSTDESETSGCVTVTDSGETTEDGTTIYLRRVFQILAMYDVTVAANPAFPDTEIEAREQQIREVVENGNAEAEPQATEPEENAETVEPVEEAAEDEKVEDEKVEDVEKTEEAAETDEVVEEREKKTESQIREEVRLLRTAFGV